MSLSLLSPVHSLQTGDDKLMMGRTLDELRETALATKAQLLEEREIAQQALQDIASHLWTSRKQLAEAVLEREEYRSLAESLADKLNSCQPALEEKEKMTGEIEMYRGIVEEMEAAQIKGLLAELALQAENKILHDSLVQTHIFGSRDIKARPLDSHWSTRMQRTVQETTQTMSELGESKVGYLQRELETLGGKSTEHFEDCIDGQLLQNIEMLEKQADQLLRVSLLFLNDAKSGASATSSLSSSKVRIYADSFYDAGLSIQQTVAQVKKASRPVSKLGKTNTYCSLAPNTMTEQQPILGLGAGNDSFLRRIHNQSLLRDVSCGSLKAKDDRRRPEHVRAETCKSTSIFQRSSSRGRSRKEEGEGLMTISEVDTRRSRKHKPHISALVSERLGLVPSRTPDRLFSSFRDQTNDLFKSTPDPSHVLSIVRLSQINSKHECSLRPFDQATLISKVDGHKYYFSGIVSAVQSKNQQAELKQMIKPCLTRVFEGKSSIIFSLGGNYSGKSFSIQGTRDQPGLLPRTIESIFNYFYKHNLEGSVGCAMAEFDQHGNFVDLLKDQAGDDKENQRSSSNQPSTNGNSCSGQPSKKVLTVISSTEPEQVHRIIKKGILAHNSHKKSGNTSLDNIVFKFHVKCGTREGTFCLVELSAEGLVQFDRSRIRKMGGQEGIRKLESVYQSSVVKALLVLLQSQSQTAFVYILNISNFDEQTRQLLAFSQMILEKSDTERLSKNLRLIVSKKLRKTPSMSGGDGEKKGLR